MRVFNVLALVFLTGCDGCLLDTTPVISPEPDPGPFIVSDVDAGSDDAGLESMPARARRSGRLALTR